MNKITNSLEMFLVSEKEAKVYLACLELGNSLASEISLKSKLPRTLIYDILERECGPCVEVPLPAASGREPEISKFYSAEKVSDLVSMLVGGVSGRSRFGTTLSRSIDQEGFVNRSMVFSALVKYNKLTKLLKNYNSRETKS